MFTKCAVHCPILVVNNIAEKTRRLQLVQNSFEDNTLLFARVIALELDKRNCLFIPSKNASLVCRFLPFPSTIWPRATRATNVLFAYERNCHSGNLRCQFYSFPPNKMSSRKLKPLCNLVFIFTL